VTKYFNRKIFLGIREKQISLLLSIKNPEKLFGNRAQIIQRQSISDGLLDNIMPISSFKAVYREKDNLLFFDNGGWAGYGLPNPYLSI
jgi:hypothetical protein